MIILLKMIFPLSVIFYCISVVKSETCLGIQEKAILSGIKASIKTLEKKLDGKQPIRLLYTVKAT